MYLMILAFNDNDSFSFITNIVISNSKVVLCNGGRKFALEHLVESTKELFLL